jgi:alanyl-tRNA synthetase
MMTSVEIRKKFLEFFESKGHTIVPSAPIVIKNDPTLLFTNAGMNPFKDYFLGNRKAPYPRIADTQKCLRVSGKHNDLEEVGVDTYHHTMFEMLGNWSFGDPARPADGYFKKEAIAWSWELLTAIYRIPVDRLYVTVFEGDEGDKLPRDTEAIEEWKKWIAAERILMGNKKDNFWEMGDTGPCGPCTEIHVDCRPDAERKLQNGAELVNSDHPQVIEIWNNVFIQFNRLKDGNLEPLPARHVDTGMGLERLVRVLQEKTSNYDTDLFTGTIAVTEKITGKHYEASGSKQSGSKQSDGKQSNRNHSGTQSGTMPAQSDNKQSIAFRVIADHIRAIAFTIADGQLPSNTGAGYVIRRILRRAVRYYYSYLDYKQPLLFQLMPVLAEQFAGVFPELQQQIDFVTKVVKEEEEAFLRTLSSGIERFNAYIKDNDSAAGKDNTANNDSTAGDNHSATADDRVANKDSATAKDSTTGSAKAPKTVDGTFAFELNDTFGFPIDLTSLMAKEIGWSVDMQGFDKALQQQKARSRAATTLDTEDWVVLEDNPLVEFVGYDLLEIKTSIVKYRKIKAKGKESWQLVLEATPFYAESGGQVGDTGILESGKETIRVIDTRKENDLITHFTEKLPSDLHARILAKVDRPRRKAAEIHHSATHLLHAALRQVLGTHVAQKGSLVNAEQLRFDFSHFAKMTDEEIAAVETIVNARIRENIPVVIREMPKEEAMKLGAMALFGEKYGDIVRVVIIDPHYSVELCGGTHVGATGELGFFLIRHETAVAAGVRRIEAVSGQAAEKYVAGQFIQLRNVREAMKNPKELPAAVENLVAENGELRRKLEKIETRQLTDLARQLLQKTQSINGIHFIGEIVEVGNADALKKLCFDLKAGLSVHNGAISPQEDGPSSNAATNGAAPGYLVVLAANIEGKASVAVLLDEQLAEAKNLQAPAIIKEYVAPLIKGGGGGQKTLATAGGQDAGNLPRVIERVKGVLTR